MFLSVKLDALLTEYSSMSWTAVNSWVWLSALNLICSGGCAIYLKGPRIESRSWVPMATRERLRAMF